MGLIFSGVKRSGRVDSLWQLDWPSTSFSRIIPDTLTLILMMTTTLPRKGTRFPAPVAAPVERSPRRTPRPRQPRSQSRRVSFDGAAAPPVVIPTQVIPPLPDPPLRPPVEDIGAGTHPSASGWPLAQPRELPAHAFVAGDEESGTETTQTSATDHASSETETRALLNRSARSSGVAIRAPRGVSRGRRRARGGAR